MHPFFSPQIVGFWPYVLLIVIPALIVSAFVLLFVLWWGVNHSEGPIDWTDDWNYIGPRKSDGDDR